jgi:hypothetical protein
MGAGDVFRSDVKWFVPIRQSTQGYRPADCDGGTSVGC